MGPPWFNAAVRQANIDAWRRPLFAIPLVLAWLVGCSPGAEPPVRVMLLEQMRPRREARIGVFLNEVLVLHFSEDVDPASVTTESLSVRPLGQTKVAQGRFEVDGRRVRFVPSLGLSKELDDGGFKPGTRYELLVRGFPALDGVRSTEGLPLARSARLYFETAALSEPRGQMYEDRTPTAGAVMRLKRSPTGSVRIQGDDSVVLTCGEPLDPSTLVDGEFVLQLDQSGTELIPLDPHLVSNSHETGAVLELRPRRILSPGDYYLRPLDSGGSGRQPQVSVKDFGGNQVWYLGQPSERKIEVQEAGDHASDYHLVETFLDDELHSPLVVPGVDGSAHWDDTGQVTIRFPRIAGSGEAGETLLEGSEARKDIHATRLRVPEAGDAQLISVPGLVCLRAQGLLEVSGRLVRRSGEGEMISRSFERGEDISDWLGRAEEADPNWTVLVAGGDLVIDGEIEVSGPLLLAAGGRIRITGKVRAQRNELWLVGEGGGGDINPTASRALMHLDPPFKNPLVEPLTFAVLSNPMPRAGGVTRWSGAEVEYEERNGGVRVQFLPPDLPFGAPLEEWGAVDHPRDLLESSSLRLLIHLRADPTGNHPRPGRWYPPVVDSIRLSWEP